MKEFFEVLPDIILYIVYGFVFLQIFRYIGSIQKSDEYKKMILDSLMIGFILKSIYWGIPFSINPAIDIIGTLITTAILAFILGKLYSLDFLDKIFQILGVRKNRNKYIWQDAIDNHYATGIQLFNSTTKEMYFGTLVNIQDFTNEPYIIINHYIYWNDYLNEKPTYDFSENPENVCILNTGEFSQIQIKYDPKSSKIRCYKENIDQIKKRKTDEKGKSKVLQNV